MTAGRTHQARITDQGVKTMGEGKAASKPARAARMRGGPPLKDPAGPGRNPLWLKWRVSLGETHLPDSP